MTELQSAYRFIKWQSVFPRFELWRGKKCLGFAKAQEEAEALRAKFELLHQVYGIKIRFFEKKGDKGKEVAKHGRGSSQG